MTRYENNELLCARISAWATAKGAQYEQHTYTVPPTTTRKNHLLRFHNDDLERKLTIEPSYQCFTARLTIKDNVRTTAPFFDDARIVPATYECIGPEYRLPYEFLEQFLDLMKTYNDATTKRI